jgi:hypothetical protein
MQRKRFSQIAFVALLSFIGAARPQDLAAQGYVFFNGAGGGAAHAGGGGFEAGKIFPRDNPRFLLGGAFSVINNGYPEQQVTPFIQTHVRDEQEIALAGGIRLARGVYAVGTGGITARDHRDYLTTNTGRQFIEDYSGTVRGCGSGQLRFVYRKFMFGVGYHSRRGVVVGVGFTFSPLRPGRK